MGAAPSLEAVVAPDAIARRVAPGVDVLRLLRSVVCGRIAPIARCAPFLAPSHLRPSTAAVAQCTSLNCGGLREQEAVAVVGAVSIAAPALTTLLCSNTTLTPALARAAAAVPHLATFHARYSTVPASAVEELATARRLSEVDLAFSSADDAAVALLQGTAGLRALDLYGTAVTAAVVPSLPAALTTLSLGATSVGDDGLDALGRLPGLTALNLRHCGVTDAGVAALCRGCRHLTALDVSETARTGDGACRALALLPLLAALLAHHTHIADDGLAALASAPSLGRLDVRGTAVTDTGLRAFADAAPDVTVLPSPAPAACAEDPSPV